MKLQAMNAADIAVFFRGGLNHLSANKDAINALNVFPVPDGDTGVNMFLTTSSAVKNISLNDDTSLSELVNAISMGALMGARGNSGVILSQIFRGFAQGINKHDKQINASQFAFALQKGVDLSYKSVMKPVEGTILTVFKDFTAGAVDYLSAGGDDILEMLQAALAQGDVSLTNTPNLLPVLKQAGVVDAGGKGILVLMEGGLLALKGEASTDVAFQAAPVLTPAASLSGDIKYGYCSELMIKGSHLSIDLIRDYYKDNIKGDSLLVVGTDQLVKVHYHTNAPWKVIEYASRQGDIYDIKIDNMRYQHSELAAGEAEPKAAAEPVPVVPPEPQQINPCGVLAVCTGDGIAAVFEKMGASVLFGGQTMNPSAEEILNALQTVPAEQVVIMPNNSNIILAAQQAAKLADKPVAVLPSKFVTQGISAMLIFDANATAEDNAGEMEVVLRNVRSGELTYAVRDSSFNDLSIKAGDLLLICEGAIFATGQELYDCLQRLVDKLTEDFEDAGVITIFYGEDVSEEKAADFAARIQDKYPDLDVECVSGGQPLYYFLVSVE